MREQYLYQVYIKKRDYTGNSEPLYPTSDCITLKCGKVDDNEFTATKPSELTLSLLCRDDGRPYLDLFTVDPFEYIVDINICTTRDTLSCIRFWTGYLAAGSYIEPYARPPYEVTLKATDGIALLKDIAFTADDGRRHAGIKSIYEIITLAMSPITDDYIIVWPLSKIRPSQTEDTANIVALNCADIYSKYGDDVSCYDVLEGVLQSFGLQLCQINARWQVRSIASLARQTQPTIYDMSAAEGSGMSATADMSLLPPYNKMTISRDSATTSSTERFGFLDHNKWSRVFNTYAANIWSGDDFMRLRTSEPAGMASGTYSGFAWASSVRFERADNMALSVSVEAYNLRAQESRFRIGFFLEDSAAAPLARWLGKTGHNTADVKGWNPTSKQWEALPKGATTQRALLANYTTEISIAASKRYSWFNERTKLDNLSSVTADISADSIAETSTSDSYLVVVIVGNEGSELPPIMLTDPALNVGNADDSQPQNLTNAITISGLYTENIEYKQDCQDTYILPNAANALSLPLLNQNTQKVITAVISPNLDSSLAAAMARDIISLRGQISMQLQGELAMHQFISFNTLLRADTGRVFYVNYIKYATKRGLYDVQLRELPEMNPAIAVNDIDVSWSIEAVVSFDTSAILLDQLHKKLYHFDELSGRIRTLLVAAEGETLFLRKGIAAACVCSVIGSGVNATVSLRAFDSSGAEISHIANTSTVIHVLAQNMATAGREAQYDAVSNTWTTLINISEQTIYMSMFDREGIVIADGTDSTASVIGAQDFQIMPNGYTYTSTRTGSSYTVSLWHNNSIHARLGSSIFDTYTGIVAVNSVFIVSRKSGKYSVFERTDAAMSYNATALFEHSTLNTGFVDMNNAIVVFRTTTGYNVYDARTNRARIIPVAELPVLTSTTVWLSSDRLYYGRSHNGKYRISYIQLS